MVVLATSSFYIQQELKAQKQKKANQSKSGASLIRYTGTKQQEIYDKDNKIQIVKSMRNVDVGQPNPYYKQSNNKSKSK